MQGLGQGATRGGACPQKLARDTFLLFDISVCRTSTYLRRPPPTYPARREIHFTYLNLRRSPPRK